MIKFTVADALEMHGFPPVEVLANESHSACPVCGGYHRCISFHPDNPKFPAGIAWCRQCGARLTANQYTGKLIFLGYGKSSAGGRVSRAGLGHRPTASAAANPSAIEAPGLISFIAEGQKALASPAGAEHLHYLSTRGISKQTAMTLGIGCCFGTEDVPIPGYGKTGVWNPPAGLILPNYRNGKPVSGNIRVLSENGISKYCNFPMVKRAPYIINPAGRANLPCVIVESFLDAALLFEKCGAAYKYVALGSAGTSPDFETVKLLRSASKVVFIADNDVNEAGKQAYEEWNAIWRA